VGPSSPFGLRETPKTVQAVEPAGRDDTGVIRVVRAAMVVVLITLFGVLPTQAAGNESVRELALSGVGGRVVAWPDQQHVEATFEGVGTMVFDNARVIVKKDRVSISARSGDRTLYAWGNRFGGGGGIGVVVKSRARKVRPTTYSAIVNRITLNGADAVNRR
jgi:hypothetical protein